MKIHPDMRRNECLHTFKHIFFSSRYFSIQYTSLFLYVLMQRPRFGYPYSGPRAVLLKEMCSRGPSYSATTSSPVGGLHL